MSGGHHSGQPPTRGNLPSPRRKPSAPPFAGAVILVTLLLLLVVLILPRIAVPALGVWFVVVGIFAYWLGDEPRP